MSPGTWQPPSQARQATGARDALLEALAPALQRSTGVSWDLTVERERLAGRSDIQIVRGESSQHGSRRWVVKHPHPAWSQDDVDSPVTAREEFAVLERLDRHFRHLEVPYGVPEPVAHVPELDALVMEFVPGGTVKDLLTYGSIRRPRVLLEALASAGAFLRHLHDIELLPSTVVSLDAEARAVLAVAEEKLAPLGLRLPPTLRRTLEQVPAQQVTARKVWLHGDFGPANVVLAEHGGTIGLDASLSSQGRPEEDLARFVALVSGVIRLAPELLAGPVGQVRSTLEDRLLGAYYGPGQRPALFELTYLHQLCRRWRRLRELAERHDHGRRAQVKLSVIDRQVPLLMARSEARLVRSLGG